MATYTWEPIPEGETPEWGEWIRWVAWSDSEAEQFVGVNPVNGEWVVSCEDGQRLEQVVVAGPWLRRVEKPHRWQVTVEEYADGLGWSGPAGIHEVHIWCDADGELHIERVAD